MTTPAYDQQFWETLWSKTLREHAQKVAQRPPNAHLIQDLSGLPPGRALDAGCGHGSETLWLAARGWHVTAVDFSPSALAQGRAMAQAAGDELAARITWTEGDLASWQAPPASFELVVSLYVHIAGDVEEMVRSLADAVAIGGALFMVGHRPIDPTTQAPTAAAGQTQISIEQARAALNPEHWEIVIAQERPRAVAGTGVDAVILARRLSAAP